MAQASRDENRITTLLAVSSVDGVTPVAVYADPVTHRLLTSSTSAIAIGSTITGGTAGSVLFVGAGSVLAQDNTNFFWDATNANLRIGPTAASIISENRLTVVGNVNDFQTFYITNKNAGVSASSDFIWSNDLGESDATTYVDAGINSSTYSSVLYTAFAANDFYLYTSGQVANMNIGTGVSGKEIKFLTGGTLTANERARITATGMTLGLAGTTLGTLKLSGNTSGTTSVVPAAAASGTLTLPSATDTVAVLAASQAFTNKTYNGLTVTSTTGTITIANGKTITLNNSITFSGTDSTTMTFPTTSKTLAANDGSNWTFTSQAIGDIVYASSTTAFTRLAAVAVGQVLSSAGTGTAPAWSSAPQITTIELGNASDTTLSRSAAGVLAVEGVVIPSISSTNTLTNKRITRRTATTNAPGATPTTNSDNVDLQIFTGLSTAITSMTTNLSGTANSGDFLEFWLTDNGTARAITWGASFAATTVALPTTTVISTKLRVLFEWGGSTWDCVATA